jgi:hypothetical protein
MNTRPGSLPAGGNRECQMSETKSATSPASATSGTALQIDIGQVIEWRRLS